ncbi:MAG: Hint domain-containing protein [Paracoccaceae bacterium]|nr:Hint domain-containing protein [Paracoccaceae bacterium]
MPRSIDAKDNEFATSTGRNVNPRKGLSRFDNPPNGSRDLKIEAKETDDEANTFEVGDTYDITWDCAKGGGCIEDAVVVRSDNVGEAGIIVFEGTTEEGETAQVIWTPEFDIDNWYWSHYSPRAQPKFYTSDQNSNYTYEFVCFEARVRLHTPRGLQPAATLRVGDTVCTWGGKAQPIRWIGCKEVPATGAAAPIRFAPDTIGNFAPVKLSPQHRVLISSPQAELKFGVAQVFVPAISLLDGKRVRQVSRKSVLYVHILLDQHDVLIAEGAPCESLLPGYRTRDCLSATDRAAIRAVVGDGAYLPAHPILRRREAEVLTPGRRLITREPALF